LIRVRRFTAAQRETQEEAGFAPDQLRLVKEFQSYFAIQWPKPSAIENTTPNHPNCNPSLA